MSVWYPYALRNLGTVGMEPSDTDPVLAVHFNRLFQEITAIESTLGPDPAGSKTDVKTRLSVCLNDNGTLKKELVCEDDPSGNKAGSYRWSDTQWLSNTWGPSTASLTKFVPLPYCAWDVPPVFVFAVLRTGTSAWYRDNCSRQVIRAISEVGASTELRQYDGQNSGATVAGQLAWWAVSEELVVWEEDVAWAMRPVRTGS